MSMLTGLLRAFPYFAPLDAQEIERIGRKVQEHSFAKGEVLFLEGEPCQGLYIVKSGEIRIFKSSSEGREQVLFIARPKDSFNDVPVFDGGPNPASASALELSTVYIVPKEVMLSLVRGSPAALAVIRLFAARLRHLTLLVEDLSFRQVVSRLAKRILELSEKEGQTTPELRLTQDELAAMVGSVRDVVGRGLKNLERAGAIRMEGQRIVVLDRGKLQGLV